MWTNFVECGQILRRISDKFYKERIKENEFRDRIWDKFLENEFGTNFEKEFGANLENEFGMNLEKEFARKYLDFII